MAERYGQWRNQYNKMSQEANVVAHVSEVMLRIGASLAIAG